MNLKNIPLKACIERCYRCEPFVFRSTFELMASRCHQKKFANTFSKHIERRLLCICAGAFLLLFSCFFVQWWVFTIHRTSVYFAKCKCVRLFSVHRLVIFRFSDWVVREKTERNRPSSEHSVVQFNIWVESLEWKNWVKALLTARRMNASLRLISNLQPILNVMRVSWVFLKQQI